MVPFATSGGYNGALGNSGCWGMQPAGRGSLLMNHHRVTALTAVVAAGVLLIERLLRDSAKAVQERKDV